MKTVMKFVMLSVIMSFFATMVVADTVTTPKDMAVSCKDPKPEKQDGLIRYKGDTNQWTFRLVLTDGARLVKDTKAQWSYTGKGQTGSSWGLWAFDEENDPQHLKITWSSPDTTGEFQVTVSGQITCGDGPGEGKPIDFEAGWDGDVVSVTIERDGNDITEPQDNPQEVKVGQIMKLTAEVQNAPADADIKYQWTVPGIIVKDWVHNVNSSEVKKVLPDDMKKPGLDYAWVDGGNARQVVVAVTVNGVTVPSAKAMFNVTRPNYNIEVVKGFNTLIYAGYDENNQLVYILGDGVINDTSSAGVSVKMMNVPPDQRKYCQFWQIVTGSTARRKLPSGWQRFNMSGGSDTLDTTDPYGKLNDDINEYRMVDSPGVYFPGEATEVIGDKAFATFLMFKPPGSDAIWVPLAQVNWRWRAKAIKAGTNWAPSDIVESIPPVSSVGQMTTQYPGGINGWSKNIANGTWVNEN